MYDSGLNFHSAACGLSSAAAMGLGRSGAFSLQPKVKKSEVFHFFLSGRKNFDFFGKNRYFFCNEKDNSQPTLVVSLKKY